MSVPKCPLPKCQVLKWAQAVPERVQQILKENSLEDLDEKWDPLTSIQLEESVVRGEHLIFYSKVLTRGTVTSVKCLPVTYLCTTYYIHNTFHLAIAKNKKNGLACTQTKKKL